MNSRREQTLVRVDVAYPCQERLIQQQRLDPSLALDPLRKFCERDLERLWSQPSHTRRDLRAPLNRPELPRIVIQQFAIVQRELAVYVALRSTLYQELPRHAEMHRQEALIEFDLDELAPPRDGSNLSPSELLRQRRAIPWRHVRRRQRHRQNAPAEQVAAHGPNHRFNFG